MMKDKLQVACDYYQQYLAIPEPISKWLGKSTTTEEAAVKFLTDYITKIAANKK